MRREWWSGGVLECWSGGVVEWWSGGVVEWWSAGVVECWSAEVWSGGARRGYRPQLRVLTLGTIQFNVSPWTNLIAYSGALSGPVIWGWRFPGLKPWAEVYSPFGAQTILTLYPSPFCYSALD
jgi:hypothetical protein